MNTSQPDETGSEKTFDVFISHASEDKESFVAPLARLLLHLGVKVWYDEFSLEVGDSLSRSIDKGLASSRYGIVVLSKAFIAKPWPEYELRGLVSLEMDRGKTILPIWHGITKAELLQFSPPLADKLALDTSRKSHTQIALDILKVIRTDIFQNLIRWKMWQNIMSSGKPGVSSLADLHPGPIRHENLPEHLVTRLRLVYGVLADNLDMSFEDYLDAFRRDMHPNEEIQVWERIAASYLEAVQKHALDSDQRSELFSSLLGRSLGLKSGFTENSQE